MAFKEAELTQIKYYRNSDGGIDHVFVSYQIYDDSIVDSKYIEHWISGNDLQLFLNAQDQEQFLIDFMAPIVRDTHETWLNTPIQPQTEALSKAQIQAQFGRKIITLPPKAQVPK